MKKTIVIGFVVIMAFFATGIYAQKANRMEKGMKKMNPEMQAYINENILPVMKVQRTELDKELSQAEKSRLIEIRSELKVMRQEQGDKMKEMRATEEKPTVEQRKEMREMRNKMHNMMDEVAIMAEIHDPTISRLLDEVQPQMEQWKQDMKAMKQQNNPNAKEQGRKNKGQKGMYGPQGGHPGHGGMFGKHMGPTAFLLWNPDEPLPFLSQQANLEDNLELNVYPNPASEQVQISLNLEDDANISFSIFNKDGNEVMKKDLESVEAGLYSKTIDASGLTEGLYIIKVNVGEKSAIGRLIIQH